MPKRFSICSNGIFVCSFDYEILPCFGTVMMPCPVPIDRLKPIIAKQWKHIFGQKWKVFSNFVKRCEICKTQKYSTTTNEFTVTSSQHQRFNVYCIVQTNTHTQRMLLLNGNSILLYRTEYRIFSLAVKCTTTQTHISIHAFRETERGNMTKTVR